MERIALLYAALHQLREHSEWSSARFRISIEEGIPVSIEKDWLETQITIRIGEDSSFIELDDLLSTYKKMVDAN